MTVPSPGIQRWPRRQLLKMSKAMDKLEAKGSGDGSTTPAGPAGACAPGFAHVDRGYMCFRAPSMIGLHNWTAQTCFRSLQASAQPAAQQL
jgi:hypothetical protein